MKAMVSGERIKPTDMLFDDLISNISQGYIKIPDFQREFVWEPREIIELLDSVYNHYPIGSFLLWSTSDRFFPYRDIGNIKLPQPEGGSINYVLDGQQRITSLFASYEEAEIQVRVNGKNKIRKIQIAFDLDEENFVPMGQIREEIKLKGKRKSLPLMPVKKGESYIDLLQRIFQRVKETSPTEADYIRWLEDELKLVNRSIKYRVSVFKDVGLLKANNGRLALTSDGEEFVLTKNKEIILELLITNIVGFEELVNQMLEKKAVTLNELNNQIVEQEEVDWTTLIQLKRRCRWLEYLDYGTVKKDIFSINEEARNSLQAVTMKVHGKEPIAHIDADRYVPIKDIFDFNKLAEASSRLSPLRREIYINVLKAFKTYRFSVIYINEQNVETVCKIFERINSTGRSLDVVDLMVAKTWGPDFNLRKELDEYLKKLSSRKYQEVPHVVVLQCISSIVLKRCHKRDILSLSLEQIKDNWLATMRAMDRTIDFLRNDMNIRNQKILPFNSSIVPITYFYSKLGGKDETDAQRGQLRKWFWRVSFSNRFDSSVESKLIEDIALMDDILEGKTAKIDYPLTGLDKEKIINQEYSLGNAFNNSIMCLYASKEPRNFQNNSLVSFDDFSQFNSVQFHHIFPQGYLNNLKKDEDCSEDIDNYKNSIVNIAFVHALQNKRISYQAPHDYLTEMKEKNERFEETMTSHFIDIERSGIMENDFHGFLDHRASLILEEIRRLTEDLSPMQIALLTDEEKTVNEIEKKLRTFIDNKLREVEPNYWEKMIPSEVRVKVEKRMIQAATKSLRPEVPANPLVFCEIFEYNLIIGRAWDVFQSAFVSKEEMNKHFIQFSDYRNAIKHLRPLDEVIRKSGQASILWFERAITNDTKNQSAA